ncbi:coiled-coil domain-containing protein 86-like [Plectropomus leopardus]|uniref:coiled-coil domain-containing protein 86-like n=1 Tax=Plectropomus leopardus TaxID=160734 RepID=UPI001C4BCA25|nr:coiled-coil domain-containing protein 86-like [Plectropomus leopardus]
MSKRKPAMSEENTGSEVGAAEEEVQDPPETRRTRSGRKVRTPAALLDSEPPVRTPSRRTRKSVLQELPVVEEKNTGDSGRKLESETEEKLGMSAEPEVCTGPEPAELQTEAAAETDAAGVNGGGDTHQSGPAPAETAPTSPETVPLEKKPRLASSGKHNPVIPLGKPKSGRTWKNRNKQR